MKKSKYALALFGTRLQKGTKEEKMLLAFRWNALTVKCAEGDKKDANHRTIGSNKHFCAKDGSFRLTIGKCPAVDKI